MGEREDIYNSTRYVLDSYSLVDMEFSYRASKMFSFKTGVKNLLDANWKYYAEAAAQSGKKISTANGHSELIPG